MGPPINDIEAVRQATRLVLRSVGELTDEQAAAPSRLPGWSRAELLTHLARNADGGAGIARAGARGEIGRQYPGGAEQRREGIAAGRGIGAAALLADLRRACDELTGAWNALPADGWDRIGVGLRGERTQRGWVWSRWREVEVHHVDLGMGYSSWAWPVAFVTRGLDEAFEELPDRADANRNPFEGSFRVEATDHDRAWVVRRRDGETDGEPSGVVVVERDDDAVATVDGSVAGWGCDVLAWLYGRDASGAGLTATGDVAGLRLPDWFPYA